MSVEFGLLTMVGTILLVVVILSFILYFIPVQLWIAAWSSGAPVGIFTLIAMRLRRVPPAIVITSRISAVSRTLR